MEMLERAFSTDYNLSGLYDDLKFGKKGFEASQTIATQVEEK
jgi:hypothetical protein